MDQGTPTIPNHPWRRRVMSGLVIVVVWSIPAAVMINQSYVEQTATGQERAWNAVITGAMPWVLWACATPLVLAISRRWPLGRQRVGVALLAHMGFGALIVAVMLTISNLAFASMLMASSGGTLTEALKQVIATVPIMFVFDLIIYFFVAGVGSAIETSRRLQDQALRTSRLESQLAGARLAALRAQLQPHFLFNTLNAISSLVRQERHDEAVSMIARLSDLLRMLLESRGREVIPLAEELELIEQYLSIEQVRFGDRLRVSYDVEEAARDAPVPTLLLQPLVENAIRHGVGPAADGGAVDIRATRRDGVLLVTVSNTGAPLQEECDSRGRGVGLANTRARLRQLYGDSFVLNLEQAADDSTVARIEIPIQPGPRAGHGPSREDAPR